MDLVCCHQRRWMQVNICTLLLFFFFSRHSWMVGLCPGLCIMIQFVAGSPEAQGGETAIPRITILLIAAEKPLSVFDIVYR